MTFELLPTLDLITELYQQARTPKRFKAYLRALQGDSEADMLLPIAGFNPMARPQVLEKIRELQMLEAEPLLARLLAGLNQEYEAKGGHNIKVAINLADDLGGAWSHRYVTDYNSKFRFNGLLNRNFCTPYLWTSETYTKELLQKRCLRYLYRTIYRQKKTQPETLKELLEQEFYVEGQLEGHLPKLEDLPAELRAFYQQHRHSEDYSCLFNFFYGDAASASLGYTEHGMERGWFAEAGAIT